MLTHKELINDRDWQSINGGYEYDWYDVQDTFHKGTYESGVGIKLNFVIVGKDELDALYRIQRIIEDKIHEVRTRTVVHEVFSDDSDTCCGVDSYPIDDSPFA